jgi:hypothetical protein
MIGARDGHVGDVVAVEMVKNALQMIYFERAANALRDLAWTHHEMFDEQLAAAFEKVIERHLAQWAVKHIFLFDAHPWEGASLSGEFVAPVGLIPSPFLEGPRPRRSTCLSTLGRSVRSYSGSPPVVPTRVKAVMQPLLHTAPSTAKDEPTDTGPTAHH